MGGAQFEIPDRGHAAQLPRPEGLRDGGRAAHQEQKSAQHGRGQRFAKWRRYCGDSEAGVSDA